MSSGCEFSSGGDVETTGMQVRRLIVKGLFIGLISGCLSLLVVVNLPKDDYFLAYQEKKMRLETLDSPKIVLIGGSSVATSVDSSKIQEATGRGTVNMGLHAGIGLRFMIDDCLSHLQEGDVLVVVGEYEHLLGILDGEIGLARLFQSDPFIGLRFSSMEQWKSVLKNFSWLLQRAIRNRFFNPSAMHSLPSEEGGANAVLKREGMNEFGDAVGHLNRPSPGIRGRRALDQSWEAFDPYSVRFLASRARQCQQKGVSIIWFYPPIPREHFLTNQALADNIDRELRKIPHLQIPTKPEELTFPESEFFDTEYHLAGPAREVYSTLLSQTLKALGVSN